MSSWASPFLLAAVGMAPLGMIGNQRDDLCIHTHTSHFPFPVQRVMVLLFPLTYSPPQASLCKVWAVLAGSGNEILLSFDYFCTATSAGVSPILNFDFDLKLC